MKIKIMSLLCIGLLGMSACVVDLSDDDVIRPVTNASLVKEMSLQALDDCGRGNVKSVTISDYVCFDGSQGLQQSSAIRRNEVLASKACPQGIKEVSANGFVCE